MFAKNNQRRSDPTISITKRSYNLKKYFFDYFFIFSWINPLLKLNQLLAFGFKYKKPKAFNQTVDLGIFIGVGRTYLKDFLIFFRLRLNPTRLGREYKFFQDLN